MYIYFDMYIYMCIYICIGRYIDFPGSSVGKGSACKQETQKMQDRFPGSGRSLGEGHGNSFQYACPENPVDRSAWRAIVHRVSKSWTFEVRRLKRLGTAQHVDIYMYMIYSDIYIYILFFIFFSMMVYHRILNLVPCAI